MLRDQGIRPDVIVGHNGWGETLYVKDVFPDVPLLPSSSSSTIRRASISASIPNSPPIFFDNPSRIRAKNAINILGHAAADWGHAATRWQRSLYPAEMRRRITAIHEGVDTDLLQPDPKAWVQLARDGLRLTREDKIITYVSRSLEPYRGFHSFMRALPEIQRRHPSARALIVGNDRISYGPPVAPGTTFRETMLNELGDSLDLERVHFLGQLSYEDYVNHSPGLLGPLLSHISFRPLLVVHRGAVLRLRRHRLVHPAGTRGDEGWRQWLAGRLLLAGGHRRSRR
jgi:Glycosyltransferase